MAAQQAVDKPGYLRGRHFTTYVEDVKTLKREGKLDEARALLAELIDATEAEARKEKFGVAPWYYAETALICRKQKDRAGEIAVLERYAAKKHAPGATPDKLLARLEKLKSEEI